MSRYGKIFFWLSVLSMGILLAYLHQSSVLPLKTIQFFGEAPHVSADSLEKTVTPLAENHGFFTIDITLIQQKLLNLPWIETVMVRKIWPDTLRITLTEHKPFAYWGEDSLMTLKGVIFKPNSLAEMPSELPKLEGPLLESNTLLQRYQRFSALLKPLDLSITFLKLSQQGSWQVTLNNGVVISLGQTDIEERFQRFVKVYVHLMEGHSKPPISIHLEYANELAVAWH